jgi:acetyltransferase-like isoleucine patch superfamily enzyme
MIGYFKRCWQMLYYSIQLGKKVPFKIYGRAAITIRKNVVYTAQGRLNIGLKSNQAVVSVLPANLYFGQASQINLGHSICIGPGVNLIAKDKARLTIGTGTYFTSNNHIEAVRNISIGENCAISWGVTIIDSDHHRYTYEGKESEPDGSITIGNKVWIGCNVTVLSQSRKNRC